MDERTKSQPHKDGLGWATGERVSLVSIKQVGCPPILFMTMDPTGPKITISACHNPSTKISSSAPLLLPPLSFAHQPDHAALTPMPFSAPPPEGPTHGRATSAPTAQQPTRKNASTETSEPPESSPVKGHSISLSGGKSEPQLFQPRPDRPASLVAYNLDADRANTTAKQSSNFRYSPYPNSNFSVSHGNDHIGNYGPTNHARGLYPQSMKPANPQSQPCSTQNLRDKHLQPAFQPDSCTATIYRLSKENEELKTMVANGAIQITFLTNQIQAANEALALARTETTRFQRTVSRFQ